MLDSNFSPVTNNASTIDNELLYTGRSTDPETGLQLNRNRFYAAHLGRWLSRDPIEYWGGFNLNGYVLGRPTFHVDPTGEIAPAVIGDVAFCLWFFAEQPVANAPAPGDPLINKDPDGITIPEAAIIVGGIAAGNIAHEIAKQGHGPGPYDILPYEEPEMTLEEAIDEIA